ncbi:MAG: hypothetical protein AAFO82_04090 [Bacteroidota bacterium]
MMKLPIYTYLLVLFAYASSAQNVSEAFIYGEVTTWDGETYEGQLRWDKEEAFWTDMFNASKTENDYVDYLTRNDLDELRSNRYQSWNGVRIGGKNVQWAKNWNDNWSNDFTHQFSCQFGDLAAIQKRSDSKAILTFKNGERLRISGSGYNDMSPKIRVYDDNVGKIVLKWDDVEEVKFKSTPKDWKSEIGEPLFGKVESWIGEFTGYIIWDKDERLTTDELDGENRDVDLSIEFGNIRSIERRGNMSEVVLKNGKHYRLGGSNDVDDDNRGVVIVTADNGRITLDWDDFEKVTFSDAPNTRMWSYSDFESPKKLRGVVKLTDGESIEGTIVYDLDETYGFEVLDGNIEESEMAIPFRLIESIEPKNYTRSIVRLKSGTVLKLEDSQDVNERHTGLLIFEDGKDDPQYVMWKEVEKVSFK